MSANLISAVHDLVLESGLGAKTLPPPWANRIPTLLREVNPFDDGAKLGAKPSSTSCGSLVISSRLSI